MSSNQKHLKKAKLRHAEYYDMQSIQDALYEQSQQGNKFYNLMELITADENIKMAYRNLKRIMVAERQERTERQLLTSHT